MALLQLSVFAENKPGHLLQITEILGKAGVDIRAMSVADTKDFGILRMIVNDPSAARAALAEKCLVSVSEVLAIAIPDTPGSLMNVVRLLSDNNINIEYTYAFFKSADSAAYIVLQVDDHARAEELLNGAGIKMV
ncbi:MAG: ACT domain-containing protein [Clostridia bacterium]|nr:ACT domain-containing protein [Clostridia bacterium]